MTLRILTPILALAALAGPAAAQEWIAPYERGLSQAAAANWPIARQEFLRAVQERRDDSAEPSRLPGSIQEPRIWRGGSPYSANFAAAYSGYRWSLEISDAARRDALLEQVAGELKRIIEAGQNGAEAVFIYEQAALLLRSEARLAELDTLKRTPARPNWKVDTEFMTPDDRQMAAVYRNELMALQAAPPEPPAQTGGTTSAPPAEPAQTGGSTPPTQTGGSPATTPPPATGGQTGNGGQTASPPAERQTGGRPRPGVADPGVGRPSAPPTQAPAVAPGQAPPTIVTIKASDLGPNMTVPVPTGEVASVETKFALLIGNSVSRVPGITLPTAATDVDLLADALQTHAGYPADNIIKVQNSTAAGLRQAVAGLRDRLGPNATVFLFFSGVGANLGGRDFLAGTDTASLFESGSMVPRNDLVQPLLSAGATVFSFFQVSRNLVEGRSFGAEAPSSGPLSQMMGTIEGRPVLTVFDEGREVGLFAVSMTRVMARLRSNQLPITEFAWQVFAEMRGGQGGAGAGQVPSLPVRILLEPDAKF
ncbi:MAG: caspase family protein [Fimbriimonadaceae bacterium]|nr:caspase family protein [Fimbriimonadaceae bacterium]